MFALISDLHLRRCTWAKHPTLWGDAYWALQQIVDHCLQQNIPLVAAGDIFDKQLPDATSVKAMYDACDRMRDAGLPVYFIQGQHERSVHETWLGVHPWPVYVHEQVFQIGAYNLYGLDWTPLDLVRQKLAAVPSHVDFLVAHQVWGEFMQFSPECNFHDVHSARYLLTGDYHVHQIVQGVNHHGTPLTVVSPGSMHMQAVDEPFQKAFFEIVDEDGEIEIFDVGLMSRPFFSVQLHTAEELQIFVEETMPRIISACHEDSEMLEAGMPEHVRVPLVSVEYNDSIDTGSVLPVYALLREATQNVHTFLRPFAVESDETVLRVPSLDLSQNVLHSCLEQTQPPGPVRDSVQRLIDSADPVAEWHAMANAAILGEEGENAAS